MSEKKKIIITIARQYGSGGADTGKSWRKIWDQFL